MTQAEGAFFPVRPVRPERLSSPLRSLFGEHARNSVAGWSEAAFRDWYVQRRVLGITVHIPRHPDAVQRVLLDNVANYEKPRLVKRLIAPLIGRGLLTAEGELWRTQRKLVAASFAPGAVSRLTGLMADAAEARVQSWPESGTIDIARAATHTTLAIIADALFSGDPRLNSARALRHIEDALIAVGQVRVTALLGMPGIRIGHVARAGERGRRYMRAMLTEIVRERGADGGPDFLGGIIRDLHARFPAHEAETLAIDNAATFYVAGHETTANALAWSIYLLAGDQAVQERARAEARAALDGPAETLPERLPYLRQILDEALRLYPPVPRMEREAVSADELSGHAIRRGEIVSLWPWLIHRHERLWDDPDRFDPERFAPGRERARHRFQYLPFGGGPRVCVGARFATVEALVILAHWLAARRFALPEGAIVEPLGSVTLRPKGGLPVQVTPI